MKKIYFAIILLIPITVLLAENNGYAGVFLNMPAGWKQIAMGGCGAAVGGESNSGWFNPASLMSYDGFGGTAGYSSLALDRSMCFVSLAGNLKNDAAVGLSWVHADAGAIPGRDVNGDYTGALQYGDDAFFLTFAKKVIKELSIGGNVKYIQSRLSDISTYVAGFDAGIHSILLDKTLKLGAVYKNIGMEYQWESDKIYGSDGGTTSNEKIPGSLIFGAAYSLEKIPITGTAEFEHSSQSGEHFRAGICGNPIKGATLAAGFDDGVPTFGAEYDYNAGFAKFGLGYAFRLEREGLPARHSFDLIVRTK